MRLIHTLFCAAALTTAATAATAQAWVADSVNMGPYNSANLSYPNDIFYSMANGAVKTEPNDNWHIAFQMTPFPNTSVSVLANHVQGRVSVFSLNLSATAKFTTLTAADTIGKTAPAKQLYNAESKWDSGAFNAGAGIFGSEARYGWGKYNMTTHFVTGDSLYLLKIGTGATALTYKLWIKENISTPTDSINYQFRIAKWDGTGDTTVRIYRKKNKDYTDNIFGYYDIINNVEQDREPARGNWDILFTRYKELFSTMGVTAISSVTGVLNNQGVQVADVRTANADSARYNRSTNVYTTKMNEIGSDWKQLNYGTLQYDMDTVTYFIRPAGSNKYYQLQFRRFDYATSATAPVKFVFRKREVADVTGVANVTNNAVEAFGLAPNPATNNTNVMLDAKQATDAQIFVTDIAGRVVTRMPVAIKKGLNAYNVDASRFTAGTYIVTVTNGSWKVSGKLLVQH